MRAAGCSSCYSRGEENFATAVVSRLKSSAFLRRIAICSVSLVVTILGGEVVGFVFSSFLRSAALFRSVFGGIFTFSKIDFYGSV